MAYPDALLVPGEEVVLHQHPHWKMLVLPVVVLLAAVAAASFLAAFVGAAAPGAPVAGAVTWAPWARLALAVVALVVVGRFTVLPVLRWRTTHFVITTRRVLVRQGVFTRRGMDIPMSRINSVQFRHTLIQRMLGCGTLIIESASDEPLEFDDVPGVERVHTLLYREVADER